MIAEQPQPRRWAVQRCVISQSSGPSLALYMLRNVFYISRELAGKENKNMVIPYSEVLDGLFPVKNGSWHSLPSKWGFADEFFIRS